MKGREDRRYIEFLGSEPDDLSERTIRGLPLRNTLGVAVVVVSAVLLGLLVFLAFSGRLETMVSQAQTAQTASEDNLAPAGPLATQDASASESPRWAWEPRYPRVSLECMGYWCYIVQAFYAGPG